MGNGVCKCTVIRCLMNLENVALVFDAHRAADMTGVEQESPERYC